MTDQVVAEPLVPAKVAAQVLGVELGTLYRWLRRARPPFPRYRVGRRLMCRLSEVNAYVESVRG